MSNTIRIRRRAAGGASGAPASLANAELAFNEQDQTLYYGLGTGGAGGSATQVIAIGGPGTFASLASPGFTGTPTVPTASADTNTTQAASTAFVLAQAYASNPAMDGTAAAGSSQRFARGDHVHPSDTTRAPLASPSFTGLVVAPAGSSTQAGGLKLTSGTVKSSPVAGDAGGVEFDGTALSIIDASGVRRTVAFTTSNITGSADSVSHGVSFANDGTGAAGPATFTGASALTVSYNTIGAAPLNNAALTGTPTAPTPTAGDSTTKIATTAFVRAVRLDQFAVPTAAVAMNAQRLTGLADPASAQDAATKAYVDSVAQGIDAKASVKSATTANIALSGTQTVDGVALDVGDRVLVKNQSASSSNGLYVVASGAWSRAADADTWGELVSAFVFVEQGSTQADTSWVCAVDAGGTLELTAVGWNQFGAAGGYSAGNGLQLTGSVFSAQPNGTSIDVSSSGIRISTSWAGQTAITTLGTIATGTWAATAVGVAYGGTGLTAAVTGLLKGNGSAYSAATAGTDYLDPSSTVDGGTF